MLKSNNWGKDVKNKENLTVTGHEYNLCGSEFLKIVVRVILISTQGFKIMVV